MAKRRANGEGSLRQLENGTWMCQIMVGYKSDGKRDIRTLTGDTQREVIQKKDELKRKMADGTLVSEELRFEEWADTWFEHHKDNIKPMPGNAFSDPQQGVRQRLHYKKSGCVC